MMKAIVSAVLLLVCWAVPVESGKVPFWWTKAQAQAEKEGYRLIDSQGLERLLAKENPVLVDVRPKYEYTAGHIACAVNLDFDPGDQHALAPEKREALIAMLGWDKKRPAVIYCRNPQ
jgi:phage shock protein E